MPTSTQSQPRNDAQTHADPQAESASAQARTSGRRQEQPTGPEQGQSIGRTAAELGERWREMAAETGTALQDVARQNLDTATRAARALLELTRQLDPLALFAGAVRGAGSGHDGPPSGARAVIDEGFRMTETALATQRGYVDQLITTQRRMAAQIVAVGESITAGTDDQATRDG